MQIIAQGSWDATPCVPQSLRRAGSRTLLAPCRCCAPPLAARYVLLEACTCYVPRPLVRSASSVGSSRNRDSKAASIVSVTDRWRPACSQPRRAGAQSHSPPLPAPLALPTSLAHAFGDQGQADKVILARTEAPACRHRRRRSGPAGGGERRVSGGWCRWLAVAWPGACTALRPLHIISELAGVPQWPLQPGEAQAPACKQATARVLGAVAGGHRQKLSVVKASWSSSEAAGPSQLRAAARRRRQRHFSPFAHFSPGMAPTAVAGAATTWRCGILQFGAGRS